MKFTAFTVALVAMGTFGSTASLAETYGRGVLINPGAGYYQFDTELSINDQEFPAIGLEYRMTDSMAVELHYLKGDTTEDRNIFADYDIEQLRLDGHYYFNPERKLQPFLSAGVGMFKLEQVEKQIYMDDTLADVGAGVRYFFNERFSVRSDLRAINNLDEGYTDGLFNIALSLTLGGNKVSSEGDLDIVQATTPAPQIIADADGDGVLDNIDNCLDTAAGLMVDENGCAIPVESTVSMDLNVNFEFESADLPPEFYSDVKELATFLKLYKDSVVTIEGHADATGPENFNQKLSEKRAKAIRDILVKDFNIELERLKYVGFGENQPVAENDSEEGRSKNRRAATVVTATRKPNVE